MFFEKAKTGLNGWWRYAIGTIAIFFGWQTVASLPILILLAYIFGKGGSLSMDIFGAASSVGVSKNTTLALVLLTFLLACGCVFLVVKYLHKKRFLDIITSRNSFSWKRAAFGFLVWGFLGVGMLAINYFTTPEDFTYNFKIETFLPLLLISVLLLPFQTSFEELFFRGYLTQGIGVVTGSRILALLLPSIVFGLLHSANPEVLKHGFGVMMPFYIGMGLFLGIIAIMDEGIEIPLGVHFANNFTAAVFVTMDESALATDALFKVKSYNPIEDIPASIATMAVFLILSSLVFKWEDWSKLIRKN